MGCRESARRRVPCLGRTPGDRRSCMEELSRIRAMIGREDATMPLGSHLDELRRRLIYIVTGLGILAVFAFWFGKPLLELMIEPARAAIRAQGFPDWLQTTGPLESFGTYMKVSMIATLVVGAPWILYQLWLFVAPGLYSRERRFVYVLLPLSGLLTVAGLAFVYFVVVPLMLIFFVGFGADIGNDSVARGEPPAGATIPIFPVLNLDPVQPEVGMVWINAQRHEIRVCVGVVNGLAEIQRTPLMRTGGLMPQYRISEYIGMLLSMALATAAVFQTPVVVLLLGWAGLVTAPMLGKFRRHAILVCAIAGALVTPGTDPASMLAMTIPMYALYELGGLLLRILPARKVGKRGSDELTQDADDEDAADDEREGAGAGDP